MKLSKAMQSMLLNVAKYRDPMRGIYGHTEKARAGLTFKALERRGLVQYEAVGVSVTTLGKQVAAELEG